MNGKNFPKKNSPQKNQSYTKQEIHSRAPYNFIPLNKTVVEAEPILPFNTYHSDKRYTGYIDLEIEAVTPLYIRDTLNDDEVVQKLKREEELKGGAKKEPYANPDFFSPGDLIRIPGSSLRGMIRTLVEIVSFGKFVNFNDDRKFFYRALGDKSLNLREQYRDYMIETINGGFATKVKSGVIIRRGLKYFIKKSREINGVQFFRIEEEDALKAGVISKSMSIKKWLCSNRNCKDKEKRYDKPGICPHCKSNLICKYEKNEEYKIGFVKVKFIPQPPKIHKHSKVSLYYGKVTQIWHFDDKNAPRDAKPGYLVCTGWIGGGDCKKGKHLHWIINEPVGEEIEIKDDIINEYKNDKWRDDETDVLSMLEKNGITEVPIFYVENNGNLFAFGHTAMFRLPYQYKIGDLLPKDHKDSSIDDLIDIPEAIFGRIVEKEGGKSLASRVFFEDAFMLESSSDSLYDKPKIPKILGEPKPTCFQHYITQSSYRPVGKGNIEGLKSYNDSNSNIRGYKLYWHKEISSEEDWVETKTKEISEHPTQYTKIRPVKKGAKFRGRIRFENLSEVELGALLFVLALPDECCHKLGLGKPLGLGSIRIKPTLYLSERKQRYSDLFFEWIDKPKQESFNKFTEAFQSYIRTKLKENFRDLWEHERIRKLRIMLKFKNNLKKEKISYLELTEFRQRKVLPEPEEVIKGK